MIRVEIKEKRFERLPVLSHVAFEVAPAETVAITGPSGIGKSTLLRIVAGIDKEFAGRVDTPARIAMVFQEPTLLPWRSARSVSRQRLATLSSASTAAAPSCAGPAAAPAPPPPALSAAAATAAAAPASISSAA